MSDVPNSDYFPEKETVAEPENVLQEADRVAGADRSRDYGHPFENHQRIADLWNAYLRHKSGELSASDVALMMILLKVAREIHTPKRDNLVDIAGYAKCLEMIGQRESGNSSATLTGSPQPIDLERRLRIALDYDGTYTRDPEYWNAAIADAQSRGHEYLLVTCRQDTPENRKKCAVPGLRWNQHFFTGHRAKRQYLLDKDVLVNVWIDDNPESVTQDY